MADCTEGQEILARLALNVAKGDRLGTLDAVVRRLQKDIPEVNREAIVDAINAFTARPPRKLSEASARLARLKAEARGDTKLRADIDALEEHIREGTLPEKTLRPDRRTEAIKKLQAIKAEARKRLGQSAPRKLAKLDSQIDALHEVLANPDLGVKVKQEKAFSDAELEKMFQRDKLKAQVREKITKLEEAKLPIGKRTLKSAGRWIGLIRTFKTSFDDSFLGNQGALYLLSHPIKSAGIVKGSLKSMVSDRAAHRIDAELDARPNAAFAHASGLYKSSGTHGPREEQFSSDIIHHIPILRGFERAFITSGNMMRARMFDELTRTLPTEGRPTLAEGKEIASFVNAWSGRASLGKLESAAGALSSTFFAPRNYVSRLQIVTGYHAFSGSARVRKAVATEYARTFAGIGTVYLMAKLSGGEVGTDITSSDFGKIRFGQTRLDLLGGVLPFLVFGGRMAEGGETPTSGKRKGEFTPFRGDKVPYGYSSGRDIINDFFINYKLAPLPGYLETLASGENAIHQKMTPLQATGDLFAPLSIQDIMQAAEEQDFPLGVILPVMAFLGTRIQTYQPRAGAKPPKVKHERGEE